MTPNDAGTMGRDEAVKVLRGYSQQHGNPEDFDLAIAALASTEAWRDLAIANGTIVDEIREIVGLKGKPGCVVKAVRELVLRANPTVGCHCATCTCNLGAGLTVRFDLSPAEQEGNVREQLIRMGWTPPDRGCTGEGEQK